VKDFYKKNPYTTDPEDSADSFQAMRNRILDTFQQFQSAPFTLQRLCELITEPHKHYKKCDKFLRGVEKNILVVTTVEPITNGIARCYLFACLFCLSVGQLVSKSCVTCSYVVITTIVLDSPHLKKKNGAKPFLRCGGLGLVSLVTDMIFVANWEINELLTLIFNNTKITCVQINYQFNTCICISVALS
jgi:hypothetical protein